LTLRTKNLRVLPHRRVRLIVYHVLCHCYSTRPLVVSILSIYNLAMGKSIRVDGDRLRWLRVERALTLRALGEISGVAYDTINQLELERRAAHASTIRKLAEALDVQPRELMKEY